MGKIKDIGWVLLGIGVFLVLLLIPALFIFGALWVSEHVLPFLLIICIYVFLLNLFVCLPLAFFKKTRSFAGSILMLSSYAYGITLWLFGFILTYILWGVFAVIIGLFIMGIGVVPIAFFATLFNGQWTNFFSIIFLFVLTYGSRIIGFKILEIHEKKQNTMHDNTDLYNNENIIDVTDVTNEINSRENIGNKKDIKEAIEILEEASQIFGTGSFELVKNHAEKSIHSKYFLDNVRTFQSVRICVYTLILNISADLVESGQFHIYRGILNSMGPGEGLLKIFDLTMDELVRLGSVNKEIADKQKIAIRNNIKSMG